MSSRAACQRGFSLLELAVSSTLLLLALLLVSEQLGVARVQLARGESGALEPSTILAIDQIRADIQLSSGTLSGLGSSLWSHEPLELVGHPAGTVTYQLEKRQVFRTLPDVNGDSGRPMLEGVTLFRWKRSPPGDLVIVEVGYRRLPAAGSDPSVGSELERRVISVSPRANGGLRW